MKNNYEKMNIMKKKGDVLDGYRCLQSSAYAVSSERIN